MANGAAAHLSLLEAPSPFAPMAAPEPPAPEASSEIEHKIAEATADVVMVLARGMLDWSNTGMMSTKTRSETGDVFLKLYELQEAAGQLDFHLVARQRGLELIKKRYYSAPAPSLSDALVADMIGHALDVLRKVTESERARAH